MRDPETADKVASGERLRLSFQTCSWRGRSLKQGEPSFRGKVGVDGRSLGHAAVRYSLHSVWDCMPVIGEVNGASSKVQNGRIQACGGMRGLPGGFHSSNSNRARSSPEQTLPIQVADGGAGGDQPGKGKKAAHSRSPCRFSSQYSAEAGARWTIRVSAALRRAPSHPFTH